MKHTIFTHQTKEYRQNCGNVVRLTLTDRELAAYYDRSRGVYCALKCENCDGWLKGEVVRGKDTGKVKTCNVKCLSATGPACDCPCRGENHGGKHAA